MMLASHCWRQGVLQSFKVLQKRACDGEAAAVQVAFLQQIFHDCWNAAHLQANTLSGIAVSYCQYGMHEQVIARL